MKELNSTSEVKEVEILKNKIKSIEHKINDIVYHLYDLSDEDIQLIETANESH